MIADVTATWLPTADADGYRFYHNGSLVSDQTTAGWTGQLDLVDGTHTFGLEAYNQHGVSTATVQKEITTPKAPGPVEGFDVSFTFGGLVEEPAPGGSGGFSYTATHYVVPYASASGSPTSDYDTQSQATFDAATSSSTPCTLGCAMQYAVAGDVVECAPGTYVGLTAASQRFNPAFEPANNGTASDPIIFYAQYPAASNYGSTSLYSELRRSGTPSTNENPVIGSNNQDYIIFDGFYVNEVYATPPPNGGTVSLNNGAVGCAIRRFAIDRNPSLSIPAGYNGNSIYFEATADCTVADCYFTGAPIHQGNAHNDATIEVYNSSNFTLEHLEFFESDYSIYIKENDSRVSWPTHGEIRYVKCHGEYAGRSFAAIELQQGEGSTYDVKVHHCLVYNKTVGMGLDSGPGPFSTPARDYLDWNFYQNTIVLDGDGGNFDIGWKLEGGQYIINSEWHDNIIYRKAGSTAALAGMQDPQANFDWTDWTMNNNCYFNADGTIRFKNSSANAINTFAAWTADTGETNSYDTDPEFVDINNDDYRLANNGQDARVNGSGGTPMGCYETGSEEIGLRTNPVYDPYFAQNSPLFFDDFNYSVNTGTSAGDRAANQAAFLAAGWSGVKAENTQATGNPHGFLSTTAVSGIPGHTGTAPGSTQQALRMASLPVTYGGQTDFYLQLGSGTVGSIPAKHYWQFWIYVCRSGAEMSTFHGREKFIYPTRNTYPGTVGNNGMHYIWELSSFPSNTSEVLGGGTTAAAGEVFALARDSTIASDYPDWNHPTAQANGTTSHLGQNADASQVMLTPNTWTEVRIHFDCSGANGLYEVWKREVGQPWTLITRWQGGASYGGSVFDWNISAAYRDGYALMRMPTTMPGNNITPTAECWLYMQDFAMAGSVSDLPTYEGY